MDEQLLYREIQIDSSRADAKARTVEASFSSTEPVERYDGLEVLSHTESAIDMSRASQGLALLLNHDPTDSVGIVENIQTDGSKLRGTLRFGNSQRAKEVWADVQDGIMKSLSVGYRVLDTQIIDDINDQPAYMATRWQPYEASLVSIAADTTVGIGRSHTGTKVMTTETQTRSQQRKENKTVAEERERTADILAIGSTMGVDTDLTNRFVRDGKSVDAFRAAILDMMGNGEPFKASDDDFVLGLTERETRSFSLSKLILAQIDPSKFARDAAFEIECSRSLSDKLGRQPQGYFLPGEITKRALTSSGSAGSTIGSDHLGGSFIEMLRNNTQVINAGATELSGLVGNVSIPRQTGAATTAWIAEGADATETDQTFDNVVLSPSTLSAWTTYTRRVLLQSSPSIDQIVMSDLASVMAIEIDRAAIVGSGTGEEPTGILNTTGIGDVPLGTDGAALAWSDVVDVLSAIEAANVEGGLTFLANSLTKAALLKTEKFTGTNGAPIWDLAANGAGSLAGTPTLVSNNVPSNLAKGTGSGLSALICGKFSDLLLGYWGGLDIMVDPYTLAASGGHRIIALYDLDIQVRHAESFAAAQDVIA